MLLVYVSQQGTICYGLFIFIIGVVGNAINIFIFGSVHKYRTTVSTFYYLIGSIVNFILMFTNVGMRIIYDGFVFEPGSNSNAVCKIRRFCNITFGMMSLCFSCLATIDQYFATSPNVRIRNCSNIKWAHRITIIVIIICCLHGIPYLIFANLSPVTGVCRYIDAIFEVYVPLFIV
ncbi:unnamed protein product, partial [Adineta ricciae]